jgi:hypothetical protein
MVVRFDAGNGQLVGDGGQVAGGLHTGQFQAQCQASRELRAPCLGVSIDRLPKKLFLVDS